MKDINGVNREERGWPGHYICADKCVFRRNTLLWKGSIYIVVSSVGHYINHEREIEEIGLERYYETMAFYSKEDDIEFHDADVSKQISFESEWAINEKYKDNEANAMHECVVDELSLKIKDGKFDD